MPEVKWPKLSLTEMAHIAPVKDGKPDTFNFMPTRFITLDEAKARNWSHFFIGESCKWGHTAPRYVSNPRLCVDCNRVRESRQVIGAKGEKEYSGTIKTYKQRGKQPSATSSQVTIPRPLEPDALEKRFLTEYAATKSFVIAALRCGRTEADFLARLSYDKIFRDAVYALEEIGGMARTPSLAENFDWDDDKRVALMRTYINTGDMVQAMRSIGVSNFHYEKEMEENAEFRADMDKAAELAWKHVDRTAVSLSLNGDSRLLQRVLAGNIEKYGERLKVDMNVSQKLTDDQLNERLKQAFERLGHQGALPALLADPIDAEFSVDVAVGEGSAAGVDGSEDPPDGPESNLDLV